MNKNEVNYEIDYYRYGGTTQYLVGIKDMIMLLECFKRLASDSDYNYNIDFIPETLSKTNKVLKNPSFKIRKIPKSLKYIRMPKEIN